MRSIKKQQEWCADQVDNPSQNWDNLVPVVRPPVIRYGGLRIFSESCLG